MPLDTRRVSGTLAVAPRARGDPTGEVWTVYVVIRRYAGAGPLIAELERRSGEVEQLIRGVPGFGAYYAVHSGMDGLATITVCDDKSGTDESNRVAREWVRKNVPGLTMGGPEVIEGQTFIEFWR